MEFLFMGYVVDANSAKDFPHISYAGNNFQLGFIEALGHYHKTDVISCLPVASWPTGGPFYLSRRKYKALENNGIKVLPFLNVRFIKEFSIMLSAMWAITKYCVKNKGEKWVVSYNGYSRFSIPILFLKKIFGYKYMCIVADPPLFSEGEKKEGLVWDIFYRHSTSAFLHSAEKSDICVVLNDYFAKIYLKRNDCYLMTGGISEEYINHCQTVDNINYYLGKDDVFHIVFTGSLCDYSGIMRLIDMFKKMHPQNAYLHIFGKGYLENQIELIVKDYPEIIFHGFIRNEVAISIQKKASLLVCVPEIDHPINKVSFPSKLHEYMVSGTPILATKVNGLKKEYLEHIFTYDGTFDDFQSKLSMIMQTDKAELAEKAEKTRQFAINNLAWDIQVKKLLKFLETRTAYEK